MGWEVGIVMVVLRIAVPLLLTFGIGYALGRLDAKWEAEQKYQPAPLGV
jgi:hypothetical protein